MDVASSETIIFDSKLIEEKEYWIEKLSDVGEVSNLIADFDRQPELAAGKDIVRTAIAGGLFQQLVKLADNSPFLIYVTLATSMKICLWKYTGSGIITIGSPCLQQVGGWNRNGNVLA